MYNDPFVKLSIRTPEPERRPERSLKCFNNKKIP